VGVGPQWHVIRRSEFCFPKRREASSVLPPSHRPCTPVHTLAFSEARPHWLVRPFTHMRKCSLVTAPRTCMQMKDVLGRMSKTLERLADQGGLGEAGDAEDGGEDGDGLGWEEVKDGVKSAIDKVGARACLTSLPPCPVRIFGVVLHRTFIERKGDPKQWKGLSMHVRVNRRREGGVRVGSVLLFVRKGCVL
jgi:hypothetical protein